MMRKSISASILSAIQPLLIPLVKPTPTVCTLTERKFSKSTGLLVEEALRKQKYPITSHQSKCRSIKDRLKSYRFQMRTIKNSFMLSRFQTRASTLVRDSATPTPAITNKFMSQRRNKKRFNLNLRTC